MGREQAGTRQCIFLFLAGMMFLSVSGCASLPPQQTQSNEAEDYVARGQALMISGDFVEAREELAAGMGLFPDSPSTEKALHLLGLIAVHDGSGEKNYTLAASIFQQVVDTYPQSFSAQEARIWLDVLNALNKPEPIVIEATIKKIKKTTPLSSLKKKPLVVNNDFDQALKKNEELLENAGGKPPAAEALFNMGLILAKSDNPDRDYSRARQCFSRVVKEFPGSSFHNEAQVWVDVLDVMEKATMIDLEIENKRKEFSQ